MLSIALSLAHLIGSNDSLYESGAHLAAPIGSLSRGVTSFGADIVDSRLYVFGGYFGKPHDYSAAGQSDVFERFELADTARVERLEGGVAMQGAALVAVQHDLVRVGGMIADNAPGEPARLRSVTDVMCFDTLTSKWTKLLDIPTSRSSHDAEIVGSRLVVIGGWTLFPGEKARFVEDALVLDLAARDSAWKSFKAPSKRRALTTARLGERVVAIGGLDSGGDITPLVEFFDPVSGAWSDGPAFPGEAFGVAACAVGDHVLASGKDGSIWRLDLDATHWRRVGELTFPRFFHQMVADSNGATWILGGIDEMRANGRVKHIERFVESSSNTVVRAHVIDAPFAARNRMGVLVDGDRVLFFGGNRSLKQHDFEPDDFQDACAELDLATLAWTPRDALPVRRQSLSTWVVAGTKSGIALGGFGMIDERAASQNNGFRWDFSASRWSRDARLTLPTPRTQFVLVEHAGVLFACGGLDYDTVRGDDAFVHPTDVMRLDIEDPTRGWRDAGFALSKPRRACGSAVVDGKLFLVGGMREEFALVDDCEAIDLASGTSTAIASPRAARTSATLVEIAGKLYLCGGSSRRGGGELAPDDSIEVYDLRTNAWSVLVEQLPLAMRHVQAFVLRERLVLMSAHVEGDPKLRIVFVTPGTR